MKRRATAGSHERRISRRLDARGLPGLGDALVQLQGSLIGGRWKIDTLYAVGAEGAVYMATDVSDAGAPPRAVKIPLVPYHRPAELSSSLLRHRRESLRTEAMNLERSASPFMPTSHGLHEFENPLLDRRRGGAFTEPDPALVMERLPGYDVDLWLARVHSSDLPRALLRSHLDRLVVVLLQALNDLHERGYFYADLRPGNLRVLGRPQRRVRLLDAGSLVEVGDMSGRFPHVPHYLPVALFEQRYTLGQAIVPSADVQAVMAGRTLYEVATGRVPVPGRALDPIDVVNAGVSAPVADVVDGLASGSFKSVVPALKYLSRRAQRRVQMPPLVRPLPVAARPPSPPAPRRALELEPPIERASEPPPEPRIPVRAAAREPSVPAPRRGFWRRLLDALGGHRGAGTTARPSR